jgi:histidinol-phosphatase (PHP family)
VFDYHVHTDFSVDCAIPMRTQCEAAVAAGVTEIAFTDHVDHEPADLGFGYYRPEAYLAAHRGSAARVRRPTNRPRRCRGGFQRGDRAPGRAVRRRVGSALRLRDRFGPLRGRGEIIFPDYFGGRSLDDVFLPYLAQVELASAPAGSTPSATSICRNATPRRATVPTTPSPIGSVCAHLPAMIERGVAFEINTSGLRQTPRASMPGPAIVRWYADEGGRSITTGTDSHAPQTIGAGWRRRWTCSSCAASTRSPRSATGRPLRPDRLAAPLARPA